MKTYRLLLTLKLTLTTLALLLTLLGTQAQAVTYTYNYDDAGRLTNVDYTGGISIAYTYDNNGNLLKRKALGKAPQHTVTVIKNGTGSGAVTSNPAGVNCGTDCTEDFNENTVITLTAVASAGSQFTGWTGAECTGTETCVVTQDADTQVTATFNLLIAGVQHNLNVILNPANSGTITGTGINCGINGVDCTEDYNENIDVTLTATPAAGFLFNGWTGDLNGNSNPDNINMSSDKTVTANFTLNSLDEDTDGINNNEEKGPNGNDPNFDGNNNGIADFRESETASFHTAAGNPYVTLSVPAGQRLININAQMLPSAGEPPVAITLAMGVLSFDISGFLTGSCTVAELLIPLNPSINQYYKFGPEPGNLTPHWYDFNFNGETGAVITHGLTQTKIQLNLCDGKRGDDDLTANGVIKEPGGPAIPVAGGGNTGSIQSIPVMSPITLMLLTLLLFMVANRVTSTTKKKHIG